MADIATPTAGLLPEIIAVRDSGTSGALTRSCVLAEKDRVRLSRQTGSNEYRIAQTPPERGAAFRHIQGCLNDEDRLEELLETAFLPQHSARQLVHPRALFLSPLFRVRSSSVPREKEISFVILDGADGEYLEYVGPELRQSDALVFMALLNMLRDLQTGATASFRPDQMCWALYGRYDGPARKRLRDIIYRLQRALLKFRDSSVQLVMRFFYPARGPWTVALDESIVRVFKCSPPVWMQLDTRMRLPEGLATWLYGYVESQTRLIPVRLSDLHSLCGSDASERVFFKKVKAALAELAEHGVIEPDWSVKLGQVRWHKAKPGVR